MGFLDNTGLTTFWNKIKTLANSKANKADAIKTISRSRTTLTATRANDTTFTFTQQDNNTTYSAGTGLSMSSNTLAISAQAARNTLGLGNTTSYLPVANGGTGANTLYNMLANAGIRSGYVTCNAANAGLPSGGYLSNNYIDFTVTFSPALSTVPIILLQPWYSGWVEGTEGRRFSFSFSPQACNVTKTGFTIRCHVATGIFVYAPTFSNRIYWLAVAF